MNKNVKCNGETVTQIVDASGTKLADLTAEVENEDSYVQPTSTNAGGTLTAGSTIAAGTYFTGEATVPSGGGLEDGQVAVHNIPNGSILSAQTVLSSATALSNVTATITLPESLSGVLPDYIIGIADNQNINTYSVVMNYSVKIDGEYSTLGNGAAYPNSQTLGGTTTSSNWPKATVDGTTLTITGGSSTTYKYVAGTVTFFAIYLNIGS